MDKKRIQLKDIAKVDPFKVPEGYFENLTGNIMSQLPDIALEDSANATWWHRVRPWVYMAAMFTGIFLMIRLFVGTPDSVGAKRYASADIEDFYSYYENELARLVYDDAFYLDDFTEETD